MNGEHESTKTRDKAWESIDIQNEMQAPSQSKEKFFVPSEEFTQEGNNI